MNAIITYIKNISSYAFGTFNYHRENPALAEVRKMRTDIIGDLSSESPKEDKIRMHNDIINLKRDFKKAVKEYQIETTF